MKLVRNSRFFFITQQTPRRVLLLIVVTYGLVLTYFSYRGPNIIPKQKKDLVQLDETTKTLIESRDIALWQVARALRDQEQETLLPPSCREKRIAPNSMGKWRLCTDEEMRGQKFMHERKGENKKCFASHLHASDPERFTSTCGFNSRLCNQKQPFWVPDQEPTLSLADALSYVEVTNTDINTIRMAMVGDSIMANLYEDGLCDLSRTRGATCEKYTMASKYEFRAHNPNVYELGIWAVYESIWKLNTTSSRQKWPSTNKTIQFTYIKADRVLRDYDLVKILCNSHDVILFNWGLWYTSDHRDFDNGAPRFRNEMRSFMDLTRVLCLAHVSLFYVSPPTQHFPYHPLGLYKENAIMTRNMTCNPIPIKEVRLSDFYTNALSEVEPLVFPPQYHSQNRGLRILPFHDFTFMLFDQHLQSVSSARLDCTHLYGRYFATPVFHTLALFLHGKRQIHDVSPLTSISRFPRLSPRKHVDEIQYMGNVHVLRRTLLKLPKATSPFQFEGLNMTSSDETKELMTRYELKLKKH